MQDIICQIPTGPIAKVEIHIFAWTGEGLSLYHLQATWPLVAPLIFRMFTTHNR